MAVGRVQGVRPTNFHSIVIPFISEQQNLVAFWRALCAWRFAQKLLNLHNYNLFHRIKIRNRFYQTIFKK